MELAVRYDSRDRRRYWRQRMRRASRASKLFGLFAGSKKFHNAASELYWAMY
jgi:hypothetical protein